MDRSRIERRLALRKSEACEALGISHDYLERHVLPSLRVVRRGRIVLIPVAELERFLDQTASRTFS